MLNGGGSPGHVFGPVAGLLRAVVANAFVSQRLRPLPSRQNREELLDVTGLIQDGKLTPVVGRYGSARVARGAGVPISLRRDGRLVQMDRGGHPTINPFINPGGAKNEYNTGHPADHVANYLPLWSKILQASGGYSADEATAAASIVLPDILRYNRAQRASYPNGPILTDNADLLAEFPFLGPPSL